MICKICGSENISVEYNGKLRVSLDPLVLTEGNVIVYYCNDCGVIWHNYEMPDDYYTSAAYRIAIEGANDMERHYMRFDKETQEKLSWTGTDIYRHKTVVDVGAAGGCFIDFLLGVAEKTIAIEPNKVFRNAMINKGHTVYDYVESALSSMGVGVADVITSFDVIEHVSNPKTWLKELFQLLKPGGALIVGTPTDYPILRKFAGNEFDKIVFHVSHPWIFSENSLRNMFNETGFQEIKIEQKNHYGFGNFVNWITDNTAKGDIRFSEFSDTLNEVWRSEMIAKGLGEYIVVKATK